MIMVAKDCPGAVAACAATASTALSDPQSVSVGIGRKKETLVSDSVDDGYPTEVGGSGPWVSLSLSQLGDPSK